MMATGRHMEDGQGANNTPLFPPSLLHATHTIINATINSAINAINTAINTAINATTNTKKTAAATAISQPPPLLCRMLSYDATMLR